MNKALTSLSLVAALLASSSALADDANPDVAHAKPLAPPHVLFSLGAGASFTSVDVGDVHYLSAHAHVDLGIGREILVGRLGDDRVSLALGYVGGADFNADEVLHHHGFGVTLRKSWFYVTLDGGFAMLHGFSDGSLYAGGHFGVNWGFRMGPVQLGFPVSVDVFNAPATTFAATLGVQL